MKSYEKYYIERLIDKLNEYNLYYMDGFESLLRSIDDPISYDLIEIKGKDNGNLNTNFIDIDSSTDDKLSFKEDTKINKSVEDELKKMGWNDKEIKKELKNDYRHLSRSVEVPSKSIKVGRMIQKLLSLGTTQYKASDIERFVNKFIASQKEKDSSYTFGLLKGNKIVDGYTRSSYKEDPNGSSDNYRDSNEYDTTLHQSCMVDKDDENNGIFDIYTENSNVNLLVLYQNNEIIGRALVWNNVESEISGKTHNFTFLDRIYYMEEFILEKFKSYAIKNGWAHRKYNTYDNKEDIFYKGNFRKAKMKVKLEKSNHDYFPYMDTFTYIVTENNYATNSKEDLSSYFICDDTDGSKTVVYTIVDVRGVNRSQLDCFKSKLMNGWIYRWDAEKIYLSYNRPNDGDYFSDYALSTCDKIILSYDNDWYLKEDTVKSKSMNGYINKDDAIKICGDWTHKNGDGLTNEMREEIKDFLVTKRGYDIDDLPRRKNYLIKKYIEELEKSKRKK